MTLILFLAAAGAAVVAYRQFRQREMRVARLWIVPCLSLGVLAASYERLDFSVSGWTLMVLGMVAGIGVGWARARLSIASVDVSGRRIVTRGGAWMLVLVVGAAALKLLVRTSAGPQSQAWMNGTLWLGVGSICAQRLYFYRAYAVARDQGAGRIPMTDEVAP